VAEVDHVQRAFGVDGRLRLNAALGDAHQPDLGRAVGCGSIRFAFGHFWRGAAGRLHSSACKQKLDTGHNDDALFHVAARLERHAAALLNVADVTEFAPWRTVSTRYYNTW